MKSTDSIEKQQEGYKYSCHECERFNGSLFAQCKPGVFCEPGYDDMKDMPSGFVPKK